jgi:transposase InsO family protein
VADALSRPVEQCNAVVEVPQLRPVDFVEMARLQVSCSDVAVLCANPKMKVSYVLVEGEKLYGDTSTGVFRPLVPEPLRRLVFDVLHSPTHPGVRATRRMVSSRFVWTGLNSDVSKWASSCITCQQSKISRHVKLQPEHVPVPSRRFAHVHVDIVGPLPLSSGCSYAFTMVDRATRWVEVAPLASITAQECAQAFLRTWVARYGVPSQLTSDRGAQFSSSLWAQVCKLLGIQHIMTSAFHPCSNGILERWHRTFKAALRARALSSDWVAQLPLILLQLRATPREDSASSPAEAVFGSQLMLPGQFLDLPPNDESFASSLKQVMSGFQPIPTIHNNSEVLPLDLPEELWSADFVLVRKDGPSRPLDRPYDGPYEVVQRSRNVFKIRMGDRLVNVSTSRLKLVVSSSLVIPARPPLRGRPRKRVSFDFQSSDRP